MADARYQKISEDLQRRIEAGEWGHGQKLPTELELRERYDASRNTIRDAINRLVIRGLIETRPGQGTYVVEKIIPFVNTLTQPEGGRVGDASTFYIEQVAARRRRAAVSDPDVRIERATSSLAEFLGIAEGGQVVSRHQRRTIDGSPSSRQTSYYTMSQVRDAPRLLVAEDIPEGTVAYLKDALGIEQVGYRDLIAMRTPDAEETTYFGLPSDGRVSVFEVTRVAFDQNGKPYRVTVTTYPADRNQIMIEIGQVPPVPRPTEPPPGAQDR